MWRSKKPTSIYFKPEGVWLTWKRMRKVYENISLKWLKTIQTSLVLPWANREWIKENQAKRAKMRDKAMNCLTVRLKRECFSEDICKFFREWKLKHFKKLFSKIKTPYTNLRRFLLGLLGYVTAYSGTCNTLPADRWEWNWVVKVQTKNLTIRFKHSFSLIVQKTEPWKFFLVRQKTMENLAAWSLPELNMLKWDLTLIMAIKHRNGLMTRILESHPRLEIKILPKTRKTSV